MKDIKQLLRNIDKKKLLIVIISILIIIFLVIIFSNVKEKETLTCTKKETLVDFKVKEEVTFTLAEEVIKKIDLEKSITTGDTYAKFGTYDKTIFNQMKNAYKYLDEQQYKLTQKDHTSTVKLSLTEDGVILDNIQIISNDPDNLLDITINNVNNLETATTAYKIGDEYKLKNLKIKLESKGYVCK